MLGFSFTDASRSCSDVPGTWLSDVHTESIIISNVATIQIRTKRIILKPSVKSGIYKCVCNVWLEERRFSCQHKLVRLLGRFLP